MDTLPVGEADERRSLGGQKRILIRSEETDEPKAIKKLLEQKLGTLDGQP